MVTVVTCFSGHCLLMCNQYEVHCLLCPTFYSPQLHCLNFDLIQMRDVGLPTESSTRLKNFLQNENIKIHLLFLFIFFSLMTM